LIREMHTMYSSTAWRQLRPACAFRVGIGSLIRYRRPAEILELVNSIVEIIGSDIPLHLWGTKLRFLQHGVSLPQVCSLDSGAWNGLIGRGHEERKQSGKSVVEYSWQVAQPRYANKLEVASARPKQGMLPFDSVPQLSARPGYHLYELHHFVIDPLFGHIPG